MLLALSLGRYTAVYKKNLEKNFMIKGFNFQNMM
jgi:hypothetical protein